MFNYGYYFADNASGGTKQISITCMQGLLVYNILRILLSSEYGEDFQMSALVLLCSNCLWLLFRG